MKYILKKVIAWVVCVCMGIMLFPATAVATGGGANPTITTLTATIGSPVVYVDDDYTDISCGGYTWGINAFSNIQGAVAAVSDGGTVYVAAGTYDENLVIGKGLTLSGALSSDAADIPIIDGSGTGVVVTIMANNVTVSGFKVQNSGIVPATDAGIAIGGLSCTIENSVITGNTSGIALMGAKSAQIKDNQILQNSVYGVVLADYSGSYATGNTISGNTFTGNTIDGIYVGELCDGNTIADNTISGSTELHGLNYPDTIDDANGIYLWKSSENEITRNTISGNVGSGIHLKGALSNTIAGNEITDNDRSGIWLRNDDHYPDTGSDTINTINNNKIYDNNADGAGYQLYTGSYNTVWDPDTGFIAINAENNWWGSADYAEVTAGIRDVDIDAVDYMPYYISAAMTSKIDDVIYVDDDYTDISCGGYIWGVNAFSNIQGAVAAVSDGGTVYVAAGTYDENLVIGKGLTLSGALSSDAADIPIIDGSGTGVVVTIMANNVTVSGFKVQNSGIVPATDAGIAIGGLSCTIENSVITGNTSGIALMGAKSAQIKDNQILQNSVYGVVLADYSGSYATGNTISGNTFTGNTIDGIYVGELCDGNTIADNTISGSTELHGLNYPDADYDANGIYLWFSSDNELSGNTIYGNTGSGIHLKAARNNTIKENTITGNTRNGIWLRNDDNYPDTGLNKINNNKIYGNNTTGDGYQLYTGAYDAAWDNNYTAINAENNWWGSADYAVVTAGIHDADIDAVDYIPYYPSAAMTYRTGDGGSSTTDNGNYVLIDGVRYKIGTVDTVKDDGTQTTVVTVGQSGFNTHIGNAAEGSSVIIPIPEKAGSTSGKAVLTAKMVDDAAQKGMSIDVQYDGVDYTLPTGAMNLDGIAESLNAGSNLEDITIDVTITKLTAADVTITNGLLVLPPIAFTVTATYNGETVEVENFSAYVDRVIEIPDDVDPNSITTAVVIGADGSEEHIPTEVKLINGKWYAIVHSLTNSTYALVYNNVTFSDAAGMWYEDIVNEMGSRMIIDGIGNGLFAGDSSITRAEFAAILVSALGLQTDSTAAGAFEDVSSSQWYYGAVGKAYEYGIITGISSTEFAPNANITRQEAMVMISRAAKIAGCDGTIGSISTFSDAGEVGTWATEAVKFNVGSKLIVGSNGQLRPTDEISRAETATVVLRLLQKAELVDTRTTA